jgi:hypothetical protein
MTRQAFLCLASRQRQFKYCNMSPTLNVFRCLLVTNVAVILALEHFELTNYHTIKATTSSSSWPTTIRSRPRRPPRVDQLPYDQGHDVLLELNGFSFIVATSLFSGNYVILFNKLLFIQIQFFLLTFCLFVNLYLLQSNRIFANKIKLFKATIFFIWNKRS